MVVGTVDPCPVRRIAVLAFACGLFACSGDDPHLSQTQQLVVSVSPSIYDFGTLQLGTTSTALTINVNPAAGANYDVVTAITESCPDFSINAPGLPANVYRTCATSCGYYACEPAATYICQTSSYQSYQFTAQFTPVVAGQVSCPVTITLSDGTIKTVSLTGTGSAPAKDIDVQPGSINFGDVRRNTASTDVVITVRNAGGTAMTVTGTSISTGFAITTGQSGSYGLAANQSVSYHVTCNPTATGALSGAFTVTSDDPATPTVNIALACNGIDSDVALSPSPTTLPSTRVGEPVQVSVAIANSGSASMNLEGVSVSGTELTLVSAPANGSYANGTIGNAVVRFGAGARGAQTGTLTVMYDGGQLRTSTITARALATSMALTPDGDVSFGPVCAGQSSTEMFTVIANDEGPFRISEIGGAMPPFTVATPNLPLDVAGSGAMTVQFAVTAAPQSAGTQGSELVLISDIPGASARTINLTVDALPAGVSPSPDTLDFGSTPPMTTTLGQQVYLSNCSSTAATFSNPRIEGPQASEFAIVQTPTGTTLAPNGKASWLVVLTAAEPGIKRAEFVVDYNDGTARVALEGEGLAPDIGGTPEKEPEEISYYGCSVSGAPADSTSRLWPLVVVVGIALRRRRQRR